MPRYGAAGRAFRADRMPASRCRDHHIHAHRAFTSISGLPKPLLAAFDPIFPSGNGGDNVKKPIRRAPVTRGPGRRSRPADVSAFVLQFVQPIFERILASGCEQV